MHRNEMVMCAGIVLGVGSAAAQQPSSGEEQPLEGATAGGDESAGASEQPLQSGEDAPAVESDSLGETLVRVEDPPPDSEGASSPAAPSPGVRSAGRCDFTTGHYDQIDDWCRLECSDLRVCLRADDGQPLCGGLPRRVAGGDVVIVRVVGPEQCSDRIRLRTATVPDGEPPASPHAHGGLAVLRELSVRTSRELDASAIHIDFARTHADTHVDAQYEIPIERRRSYVEAGLLIPLVVDGKRAIETAYVPGTAERALRVVEDDVVFAALVLNLYPLGGRRRDLAYCCSKPVALDWLSDLLALQVGIDVDFTNLRDRFFAGALLEPIAGLGIGGGVALVQGQVLGGGFAEGMILEDEQPVARRSAYFVRGYFGLTASTALLRTIAPRERRLQ